MAKVRDLYGEHMSLMLVVDFVFSFESFKNVLSSFLQAADVTMDFVGFSYSFTKVFALLRWLHRVFC